jgi:hypothetical protein
MSWAADAMAGSLKSFAGQVVVQRGAEVIPCREGMHMFEHDVLRTGADGQAGIILSDGTRVSIGPKTELGIERFLFEPAAGEFSLIMRLARGVLAYVSGRIAQFSPQAVKVETPVGVIGLRGTEFAVTLDPGGT